MSEIQGLKERVALAEAIAREGGALALGYYRERDKLVVETKVDAQDVVSIADKSVEELIRERVAARYPGDAVIGEEYGGAAGDATFIWVVDPIDGTSCFVHGIPNWCVSIAILHGETIAAGVIYVPCVEEMYVAAIGAGSTLNGETLSLGTEKTIRTSPAGISANPRAEPHVAPAIIERLLRAGGKAFENGSGALMLAYVAAGRLVGYYDPCICSWDCLAGCALVEQAGGWHSPFPTTPIGLTQRSPLLATGPGAIEDLRKIVEI